MNYWSGLLQVVASIAEDWPRGEPIFGPGIEVNLPKEGSETKPFGKWWLAMDDVPPIPKSIGWNRRAKVNGALIAEFHISSGKGYAFPAQLAEIWIGDDMFRQHKSGNYSFDQSTIVLDTDSEFNTSVVRVMTPVSFHIGCGTTPPDVTDVLQGT